MGTSTISMAIFNSYEGKLSMVPWHTMAYRDQVRDLRRCQQQVLETHRPLAGAAGNGSGEAVTTCPQKDVHICWLTLW